MGHKVSFQYNKGTEVVMNEIPSCTPKVNHITSTLLHAEKGKKQHHIIF